MRKALAFILFLVLCCFTGRGALLYAQGDAPAYDESIPDDNDSGDDSEDDSLGEPEMDIYVPDKYTKGDQTVTVSLGAAFPVAFQDSDGNLIANGSGNFTPPVGGILSLAYTYFLGANLFIGGEVGFITAFTLSENAVFIIPIGIRGGWQFVFRRFEFPVYVSIGIAPQKYLDFGYFGMYLKGTISGFFRYNPNWSFGLGVDWSWIPQWPMENDERVPHKDISGNFIGVNLSVRYHF